MAAEVLGRRVDGEPVVAPVVDQVAGQRADRIGAETSPVPRRVEVDVDPGAAVLRRVLLGVLDDTDGAALVLHDVLPGTVGRHPAVPATASPRRWRGCDRARRRRCRGAAGAGPVHPRGRAPARDARSHVPGGPRVQQAAQVAGALVLVGGGELAVASRRRSRAARRPGTRRSASARWGRGRGGTA